MLKHLLKGQGGCSRTTVSPTRWLAFDGADIQVYKSSGGQRPPPGQASLFEIKMTDATCHVDPVHQTLSNQTLSTKLSQL